MMSQKRQTDKDEVEAGEKDRHHSCGEKRQKGASFRRVVEDAMRKECMEKFLLALEPLMRKVVKEEVETALGKHVLTMRRQRARKLHSRCLQLEIRPRLALPIFTGAKIKGENGAGISIDLVDNLSGDVITSGPESSMKVEIVVLEGDFEGTEEDEWTHEEFKNNIVKERQGKRTLLVGDVVLNLNEGTTVVSELAFTDNSSWTRSRNFRLGARVETGYCSGIRIKEAITEPFTVKDHRGELYKKHHPPSLDDDVWRLEKIGKDGAFHKRLTNEEIKTVKDFLTLLCIDTPRLRNILGMSTKMWEVTIEHARTCIVGNQLYVYYQDHDQKFGAVFNAVGELKGIISEQQYVPISEISDAQKADALELIKAACRHRDGLQPFDMDSIAGVSLDFPCHSLSSETSAFSEKEVFNFPLLNVSSPDIFSSACTGDFVKGLDNLYSLQSTDVRNDGSSSLGHDTCDSGPSFFDIAPSSQSFFPAFIPPLDSFVSNASFPLDSLNAGLPDLAAAVSAFIPPHGRVNRKWRRLLPVFRLTISVKRIVASKRMSANKKVSYLERSSVEE